MHIRLFATVLVFSLFVVGCGASASGRGEVKSPANPESTSHPAAPDRRPEEQKVVDQSKPPPPPAPKPVEPSKEHTVIRVGLDSGDTVIQGDGKEEFSIGYERMLFFYSNGAAPSCANVKVSGPLVARSLAGVCQIGFLPIETKVKKGQAHDASIKVGEVEVKFKVKAL